MIYIGYGQSGLTKVGYSSNVSQRMKQLKIELYKEFEGDYKLEFMIHRYLKKYQYEGEWYSKTPKFIEQKINLMLKENTMRKNRYDSTITLHYLLNVLNDGRIQDFSNNIDRIKTLFSNSNVNNHDMFQTHLYDNISKKHLFSFLDNIDFFIIDDDKINQTLIWFIHNIFTIKEHLENRSISNKKKNYYLDIIDKKILANKQCLSEWINQFNLSAKDYWELKNKVDYFDQNINLTKLSLMLYKDKNLRDFKTNIKKISND